MSLEPILTPEEYESVCQFIDQYEERLRQQEEMLAAKEAALEQEKVVGLARTKEIVNNLQSELSALRARAQDYEMQHFNCAQCSGTGERERGEACVHCNGTGGSKPSGRWHAEVFNLSDLIKAAAANPEYEQYLQPVMPLLNKRAVKEKRTMYVPGVVAAQKVKQ